MKVITSTCMHPREVCFYCADQNPHRDRSLGISNYTLGLLNALKQSGSVKLKAVSSKSSAGVPHGIPTTVLAFRTDRTVGRLVADHLHPLMVGNRIDAHIWHYPKGFLPFGPQVRPRKIGTIADTILQFYADHYSQWRSRAAYAYWIAMLKSAVHKFDAIITVSEFSKHAILEFAERYRIKPPPIYVTYEGVDVELPASTNKQFSRDYVLHLASTAPHKRTNWLLDQWHRLQQQQTSLPRLRLIGRTDECGRRLVSALKNVEFFPPLTREQVFDAMRGALALILPSEIEGFGLPALEAYYCNTPVVYVKGTAVEEILGANTPGAFKLDDGSLFNALHEVFALEAPQIATTRADLSHRFSWQGCAQRTLDCYNSLV